MPVRDRGAAGAARTTAGQGPGTLPTTIRPFVDPSIRSR
jgi:hypothetical protein